jgi:hypothetical protein
MGKSPGPKLENKMAPGVASVRIGVVNVHARRAYVVERGISP